MNITRLKEKYPHCVVISDWLSRAPEKKRALVEGTPASWVEVRDTRTFGFKTDREADDFQVRFGGDRVRL